MTLKEKILNEMVETEEDKMVRELKKEKGFDEEFVRKRFRSLKSSTTKSRETKE